jgi:PAS domain S-box-containing protein
MFTGNWIRLVCWLGLPVACIAAIGATTGLGGEHTAYFLLCLISVALCAWIAGFISTRNRGRQEWPPKFQPLFEQAPDAICISKPNGALLACNRACAALLGIEQKRIHEFRATDFYVNPDHRRALQELLRRDGSARQLLLQFRRADGKSITVEMTANASREGGEVIYYSFLRDVSERKGFQEELQRTTESLEALVKAAPVAIISVDREGRVNRWNPAAEEMFDWTEAEVLDRRMPIVPKGQQEEQRLRREQILAGISLKNVEMECVRKDGTTIPVSLSTAPIRDLIGQYSGVMIAITDLTERKRAEAALSASEKKFEKAFRRSPALISIYRSLDLVLVDANETFLARLGYTAEEVIGRSVADLNLWEDSAQLLALGSCASPAGLASVELGLRTKSGRRRTVLASAEIVELESELLLIVAATDITERKAAEAALLKTERHCRELVENASELIFFLDLKGNITNINPAAARATGYTVEEITGMNVIDLLAPQARPAFAQKVAALAAPPVGFEVEILNKGGTVLLLEVSTSILYEDGQPVGVQNIARDITERRRLEMQLRQAQKMDAVGRLAGGVAHDFNNLLHVIRSSVELAQVKPDDLERYHENILAAADRAAELTQQLLAFSRTQVLVPRPMALNSVVKDASKLLARLIGEDIELILHFGEGLNTVHADPSQLEQVILNLAVNARDAMPRGGKLVVETRNVHLLIKEFGFIQPGDYVELLVTDTGVGMTPEVQARVFEPFFTTKEHGKGTGLGLATVYGIVKQSDGYITINSEPGVGTAVRVLLPAHTDVALPPQPKRRRPEMVRGSENVLVVEDEDGVRRAVREILQSAGYTVVEACNPAEAMAVAADFSKPIHLLLTDVVMPGCTGGVFADQFQEQHPEAKVLFISGYTDDAIVRHGLERSVVKLLKKPFTIGTLTAAVREVLDASTSGQLSVASDQHKQ